MGARCRGGVRGEEVAIRVHLRGGLTGRLLVTTMASESPTQAPIQSGNVPGDSQWPLWEVFLQPPGGEPHEHAGSVHAVDAESALQNARDVYARRGEAVSIWVVRSGQITASTPEDMGPFFDPGNDKPY